MTERRIEEAEEALARELMIFLQAAVAQILQEEDEGAFLAWVRAEAPRRLPGLFADLPNEQAARAIAFEMGREVWNKVPLPGAGYRTRPIPRPERNEPCPCGSGQKYKKCCGAIAGPRFELPFESEDAWTLVMAQLPEAELAQLVEERRIPRALLPGIAGRLTEVGSPEAALALLEPLFEKPEELEERDALAIEVLIEAYDDLGLGESKEQALAELETSLRPALRLTLWEALARSYMEEGEVGRAWEMLEKVRPVDPESSVLGWVEVALLLGEDRLEEAAESSRKALSRPRTRAGLTEEGLAWLQETADDPAASRRRMVLDDLHPSVERFQKILEAIASRPIRPYAVEPTEDSGIGRLVRPSDLRLVEAGWIQTAVDLEEIGAEEGEEGDWEEDEEEWEEEEGVDEGEAEGEEDDEDWEDEDGEEWDDEEDEEALDQLTEIWAPDTADVWLTFLEETPEAFDSLLVLAELAGQATALIHLRDGSLRDEILTPVVRRGVAILDASLAGAPQLLLPGRLDENRSALDLLQSSAFLDDEPVPDLEALERMLRLDPEDHLAARNDLGTIYLWRREPQKTLDLAARFPQDDEPYLSYARVVALRQLGRAEESLAALDEALELYPMTGQEIARSSPRIPEALLDIWQEDAELDRALQERVG